MFHWFSGKRLASNRLAWLLGLTLTGSASAQEEDIWTAEDPADAEDGAPEVTTLDEEGDIVETIGGDGPVPVESLPAVESRPAAGTAGQAKLKGFFRQSMELGYGELARSSGAGTSPLLWRDVFLSRSQLSLEARYLRGRHFEATISGVLGYALHVAKDAPQYSVGTVDLTRGELSGDLREAYLGFYWPSVDLRIGQQRIAWGRSDFQSPNDVLNARDLRDPFLSETELRHLPTMAVRSTFVLGPMLTFETVVSPLFVPDRYDVYGATWSVVQWRAEQYERFLGTTSLIVDPTVEGQLQDLWRATELPAANGKGLSAGARLRAELGSADFSVYYHYGYDPTPFVQIDPQFRNYLDTTSFPPVSAGATFPGVEPALAPVLTLIDQGVEPVSSRYVRRHHVGMDANTAVGPFVLRVDAAYQTRRVFYGQDLSSYSSPAVLGVLGVEYQTGNMDEVVLLELLASQLLEDQPPPLLGYERTTTALAGVVRWALGSAWGLDLRGLVGLNPETYSLQPSLRFKFSDSAALRVGALIVSGATSSFGWYFADNDTAFLQLKYLF